MEDKSKVTIWMTKSQKEKLMQYVNASNEGSMTAFIISAIDFYGGYNLANKSNYLPLALTSAVEGTIKLTEDRISRLLFKNTIELSMMMNVLSASTEIDSATLNKLRAKCIKEVSATRGKINFEDTYRYQNS